MSSVESGSVAPLSGHDTRLSEDHGRLLCCTDLRRSILCTQSCSISGPWSQFHNRPTLGLYRHGRMFSCSAPLLSFVGFSK